MYFIFAAMSVGIIFVIILFVLSFVILKWKRVNNGEEYVLRSV